MITICSSDYLRSVLCISYEVHTERVTIRSVDYRRRIADAELDRRLRTTGAVLIEGLKACGKTATASQRARTVFRLDVDENARTGVRLAPETLLGADKPILFDEWQAEQRIWNLVRRAVDDASPRRGLFILAGSATPDDDAIRHTGAGRITSLRMRTMSLYETGHSTGEVSLSHLFDGQTPRAAAPALTIPALIDRIVVGGWPALLDAEVGDARDWIRSYLTNIVEVDVQSLGTRRDPVNLRRLLTALARVTGGPANVTTLAADVGVERATVDAYTGALGRLMLIDDVPAWAPHMRSTTPLRAAPTRFLADPSLAPALLNAGQAQLLGDLNATGFHFEALVTRDLRAYTQPLGGSLSHWRDSSGHEVDFIITTDDGRWCAIEVKMNPDDADQAADALRRFTSKVDTSKVGDPAFLAVITATGFSYRRDDGVVVASVAALGP